MLVLPHVFSYERLSHGMGFWFGIGTFLESAIFLTVRELILPKLEKAFAKH